MEETAPAVGQGAVAEQVAKKDNGGTLERRRQQIYLYLHVESDKSRLPYAHGMSDPAKAFQVGGNGRLQRQPSFVRDRGSKVESHLNQIVAARPALGGSGSPHFEIARHDNAGV